MKRIQLDDGTLPRCERKCLVTKRHAVNCPEVYSIDAPVDTWVRPMMRPLQQLQQPLNFSYGPLVAVRPVDTIVFVNHVCDDYCDGQVVPTMHVSRRQFADNRIAANVRLVPASEGIHFGPSPIDVSSAIELRAVRI